MKFCNSVSMLAVGAGLMALAAPAYAQDSGSQDDPSGTQEIVVTAQNRSQNVQDVPIAIDVVGAAELRSAGVTDFASIDRVAPVVNITSDTVNTRVAVRGVGTNANDETQDQSIAVNIDGEYLNRPNVLNASMFDLDRVEVLRGPQGTLYGRNSTGGAINFITRKPGKEFGVNAAASYGNFNHVIVEGGVDVPLGNIGGIRLSGIYSNRDGYNYHPNIQKRSGSDDTLAGRVSLRLQPTSALTIDLAAERVDSNPVVAAQAFVNFNAAGNGPGPTCALNGFSEIAPLTPGVQCIPSSTNFLAGVNRDSYNAPFTGVSKNSLDSTAFRGRLAYDFGPATLTYTGGYRHTSQVGGATLSPAYKFIYFEDDAKTNSHELRLNGASDGGLVWQIGTFYFSEKLKIERGLFNPFIGIPPTPNGSYITYFRRPFVKTEAWSGFGQVDVPLGETLTAVAGARYTKDDRSARYENLGFLFNVGPNRINTPATAAQTLNLSTSGDKFTWLLGLNYKPNTETLVYGKVSTGFKAGGFDAVGTYAPESNTAYEGGLKLNLGETGQHIFNLAGFYYDYRNLQVSVLLDSTKGAQVFNAGKAKIWGLEAESNIRLSKDDSFNFSVNYLNSEYKQLLASYAVFCVGCADNGVGDLDNNPATVTQPNLSGNTPPQAPRWTITAGYDHIFDLGSAGTLTASAFTRFKSAYFLDIFNYRDSKQTAYTQTDLTLEYRSPGKNWSIQAFARNLEDIRPVVAAAFTSAGPDDIYNWQFGAPRSYGVRLGIDF